MTKSQPVGFFLEAIHKRPGMYLGPSDHLFTRLGGFLAGYEAGFVCCNYKNGPKPEDLVPHNFHKFVTERYGSTFPAGGKGWQYFIKENTSSEEEAFHLFFTLRAEYEKKMKTKKKRKPRSSKK